MGYVDLHVHSRYSDGTLTPAEVLQSAEAAGVTLLAIADHDMVQGSLELMRLCDANSRSKGTYKYRSAANGCPGYSVRCLSAVEHTCLFEGRFYHVLGYGADLTNPALLKLIQRARRALDGMSELLIERLSTRDARVSFQDFLGFERDPSLGGWAGIEYLWRCGVTGGLKQGMALYEPNGVRYQDADFPSLQETIQAVHGAGGLTVLAHPGEMIEQRAPEHFIAALERLLDQGLDGVECHYPSHPEWLRDECLRLCKRRGLQVTAGSDCHGAFTGAPIGSLHVTERQLGDNEGILKGLVP